MSWYDEDDNGYVDKQYLSKRKQMALPGEHICNKNEGKALRKLKIQTGLTEEELRAHKKYRIILSEAQKKKGTKNRYMRHGLSILKSVLMDLKLPKEHPKVLEVLKERIEKDYSGYGIHFRSLFSSYTPQQIISWSRK